uniref:Clusterin n=1 Tax=Apteryx owenii TaxID=8824 RepID=A0A8B9PA67_APTOW
MKTLMDRSSKEHRADGVDDLFQDSARVYGRPQPFFGAPGARPRGRRDLHPFFPQPHLGFHHLFQPFLELTQRMAEEMRRAAEQEAWQPSLDESRNFSDDRMVCREIRRNSAGCLKMRDECEKCREILSVDCSQTDPEQSLLREQLEDALRLAERFSRRYDDLLRDFQADMLNTTGLLEQLNRQFGWVSRLANLTQHDDGFLQVTTVGAPAGGGVPGPVAELAEGVQRVFQRPPGVPAEAARRDVVHGHQQQRQDDEAEEA